jgi:hypothetical protein
MQNVGTQNWGFTVYILPHTLNERKFIYLTWYRLHSPLYWNIKIKKVYIPFTLLCPVSTMAKHYTCHTEGSWTRTL